ncbi:MAG: hypothetical protein NXI00_14605 [Cytophagales bacterium]|nr:hypothetical protein [Cytophagales bacterium]
MKLLIYMFGYLLLPAILCGQQNMLIEQIEGKTIIKNSYNEKGEFEGKQVMKVSRLVKKEGTLQVKINISSFDYSNKLTKTFVTNFKCKPSESSVLLMLIPLSDLNDSKTEIKSRSLEFKNIYNLNDLKDITIELKIQSGLKGFLGSESTVTINSRSWDSLNKTLESKLEISVFALGLRIRKIHYKVSEAFKNETLAFQKFVSSDASYFTMTYQ